MFLQASVCPQRGVHDEGGVYGKLRACVVKGGHEWQGACVMVLYMVGRQAREGGMHGRGIHGRGHMWQGVCVAGSDMHGRRDGHCSRRYVSYWNAFLLPFSDHQRRIKRRSQHCDV